MRYLSRVRVGRPSPATVLAMLALMVALGGSAAANLPGNNTVISSDITNGHVRAPDIRTNAVGAVDIATDAVGSAEIDADAVEASEIATDAVSAAELESTLVTGSGNSVTAGTSNQVTATCPAGRQIVSGGFNWDLSVAGLHTTSMELNTAAESVTVVGFNDTAFNRTLSARANCISG